MTKEQKTIGIVMPISSIGGLKEDHWREVLSIITDVIKKIGYQANLVSDSDDTGVIHRRIIENLYKNPLVICDISATNPNVMVELGIRLAFDMPTIIVKDNVTPYSFDTSIIEHIGYPRDLRHGLVEHFKSNLEKKIVGTLKSAQDPSYTTFLKHFGGFKRPQIETEMVPQYEIIMDELQSINTRIGNFEKSIPQSDYAKNLERLGSMGYSLDPNIKYSADRWYFVIPFYSPNDGAELYPDLEKALLKYSAEVGPMSQAANGHGKVTISMPKPIGPDFDNVYFGFRDRFLNIVKDVAQKRLEEDKD